MGRWLVRSSFPKNECHPDGGGNVHHPPIMMMVMMRIRLVTFSPRRGSNTLPISIANTVDFVH